MHSPRRFSPRWGAIILLVFGLVVLAGGFIVKFGALVGPDSNPSYLIALGLALTLTGLISTALTQAD